MNFLFIFFLLKKVKEFPQFKLKERKPVKFAINFAIIQFLTSINNMIISHRKENRNSLIYIFIFQ